jgi:endonuclease YncB( thermonuclease family)
VTACRRVTVRYLAGAAVLLLAGCGQGPETPLTQVDRGVVADVVDGDTLRLRDGRRIRLVQIDAPEERTDCYGRAATRALAALTPPGATIALRSDPALDDADSGGRLLRYVQAGDVNVNLRLVEDGAAAPYFFRNARGRYADTLLDAARGARRTRLGLWGACPGAELNPGLGSVTGRR